MPKADVSIALRRFGLGARPGESQRIASDPRGFVHAQIKDPAAAQLSGPDLRPSQVIFAEVIDARMTKAIVTAMQAPAKTAEAAPPGKPVSAADPMPAAMPKVTGAQATIRDALSEDLAARATRAMQTETPLLERLVYFWSNHFAVSALKGGPMRAIAGAYEREAIRPHVLGRFGDMLKAVEQHPAMLIYLDNQISIGPGSPAGRNRGRGLNENLAREILELHTLGVDGGYTQTDVTNLARLLTGWTVGAAGQDWIEPGRFLFTPNRHEPGQWPLLGKSYGGRGQISGEDALADLARHPATARHIARKLAVYFVSDKPAPELVAKLEAAYKTSDGDLGHVTKALLVAEEAWSAPPRKMTPPFDFATALARGLTFKTPPKAQELIRLAGVLGQPTWQPQSPKGWPDADDAWLGPSGVKERLRIAEQAARTVAPGLDPRGLADDLLGPDLSERTRQAIARAESREQGFELMIMSPEFQRR
jgi:uncharacterized protein (DUF1800 family)